MIASRPGGTRTLNSRLKRPLLYQLSYEPNCKPSYGKAAIRFIMPFGPPHDNSVKPARRLDLFTERRVAWKACYCETPHGLSLSIMPTPDTETSPPLLSAGLWYMVATALAFSLMSVFVKRAGRGLPSQEIVLVRSAVTLGYSWALVRWRGVPLWGNHKGWLTLRGLFGFSALSCFFLALTKLPLADATVIHYTNPALTAGLAALFLGEQINRETSVGIALSLAGVALVAQPAFLFGEAADYSLLYVGIALLGALFSASAYVTVRHLREDEHALTIVFYFPLVATLASLPTALPTAEWPTPLEWLLLVVGVAGFAQLGQIFLTHGLYRERAGRAMSVSYLQIVFAGAWGLLFFGEVPDWTSVGGAALVIAGTWLTARS